MKRHYLHIGFVALCAILFLCACNKVEKKPKTNWNISLRKEGKNPYDTYLAYHSLSSYFPDATVKTLYSNFNFENIGSDDYYSQEGKSLVVFVGKSIYFSQAEWQSLQQFMRQGNEVMMLASNFDESAKNYFKFGHAGANESTPLSSLNSGKDNLNAFGLTDLPDQRFGYWGRDFKSYFTVESTISHADSLLDGTSDLPYVMGNVYLKKEGTVKPNFIRYAIGEGHFTAIASPLVLSNYFLLQDSNKVYLDHIWRAVPKQIYKIYWANFYERMPGESSFSILWRNKATRWALIVFFIGAITYLVFQIKRRQRIIPVVEEPVNSSVAFIETVGMLYYNKGDNTNLALKMEQHFLEWVRTKFNLQTNQLNDIFVQQLSLKSGLPVETVQHLAEMIHQLRLENNAVSDAFLFDFYSTIQQFYKTN